MMRKGFLPKLPAPLLKEVLSGSIAFSDIDGDGDQDVLIAGRSSNQRISKLLPMKAAVFLSKLSAPL
jgi:hypothetical protein